MAKSKHMKMPKGGKHGDSHVKLHRPKMSGLGKSAYGAGAPPMAFTPPPGGGAAFGPPDAGGGAPPMDAGGAPPMGGAAGPAGL